MFKKGFAHYIDGEWAEAKTYLEQVEHLKGIEDYPSQLILLNMGKTNFQAPDTWKGFRALTSK